MASIIRLGTRQVLNQLIRNEKSGMLSLVRPISLKVQSATTPAAQGHDERNMKIGRPLSPHLTIYKFELPSILSISHRATGMALAGYTILFGAGVLVLPDSIPHYLDVLANAKIGSGILFTGKFLLAFPLSYHFWNGIRHLLWDTGLFLTMKEVYATGYVMVALASASAIALSTL